MYSHEIEFTLVHHTLGDLPGKFRTTPDALWIHKKVLKEREMRGEIKDIIITNLKGKK